jgi:hypothetical protein
MQYYKVLFKLGVNLCYTIRFPSLQARVLRPLFSTAPHSLIQLPTSFGSNGWLVSSLLLVEGCNRYNIAPTLPVLCFPSSKFPTTRAYSVKLSTFIYQLRVIDVARTKLKHHQKGDSPARTLIDYSTNGRRRTRAIKNFYFFLSLLRLLQRHIN